MARSIQSQEYLGQGVLGPGVLGPGVSRARSIQSQGIQGQEYPGPGQEDIYVQAGRHICTSRWTAIYTL